MRFAFPETIQVKMVLNVFWLLLPSCLVCCVTVAMGDHSESKFCRGPSEHDSEWENKRCLEPLTPEDTLCGTTNDTQLQCHTRRASYNFHSTKGWWLNVCLFPIDQPTFNNTDVYDCGVMFEYYGKVTCTRKSDPSISFTKACNFTFYFCQESDPMNCVETFTKVLEEGGSCEASDNWCPSENLYSLTNVIRCDNDTNMIHPPDFKYLTALNIRPPMHCLKALSSSEEILLLIGVIGIVVGLGIGVWWYKKIIKKKRQKEKSDPVIETVESVLKGPEPFLRFRVNSSQETAEPFTAKKLLCRDGSDHSSRDTGFESVCMTDLLYVVEEDEVLDIGKRGVEPTPLYMKKCGTPSFNNLKERNCTHIETETDLLPQADALSVNANEVDFTLKRGDSLNNIEPLDDPSSNRRLKGTNESSDCFVHTYTIQENDTLGAISGYSRKTDFKPFID